MRSHPICSDKNNANKGRCRCAAGLERDFADSVGILGLLVLCAVFSCFRRGPLTPPKRSLAAALAPGWPQFQLERRMEQGGEEPLSGVILSCPSSSAGYRWAGAATAPARLAGTGSGHPGATLEPPRS